MRRAKSKEQRAKSKKSSVLIFLYALCSVLYAQDASCDKLFLKEKEEGNEIEVVEERHDSFIIKLPKNEIRKIQKQDPTDIELWKEKKVLWEDSGDYIIVYLPKEKIALPEGYTGEEYDSGKVFREQALGPAGIEGRPVGVGFLGALGVVSGRVVRYGEAVEGARLRIVNVSYQEDLVSRLFGAKSSKPEDLIFETLTDENGRFEFKSIPIGEYDIYWSPPGSENWYRRLSEKPNITVRPGETTEYPDIEI